MSACNPQLLQPRFVTMYMNMAREQAAVSYCVKRKVGCLIVNDHHIIGNGYNGTRPGECNCCEDNTGKTNHDLVVHAEVNALSKVTTNQMLHKLPGAVIYVTTAPCETCAEKFLRVTDQYAAVIYDDVYKNQRGVDRFRMAGVPVMHVSAFLSTTP